VSKFPELTEAEFKRAIPARLRKRLIKGHFESGDDVAALRRFTGLTGSVCSGDGHQRSHAAELGAGTP
jgi:hypothetical protein